MINLGKNINKIDYDLKKLFKKVNISEKSKFDKFYIEIISEGEFSFQKNSVTTAQSKVLIEKKYLEGDSIKWSYSTNPNSDNAEYIERYSSINSIATDIYETILNKKLDYDYIESVQEKAIFIKESLDFDHSPELTSEELILKVLEKNSVPLTDVKALIQENVNYEFSKVNYNLYAVHEGIKLSQKFSLEEELMNFSFVNFVNFNDNEIIVNYKY